MSSRRIASITLVLGLVVGISGCFVLFPLDEFQEGPYDASLGDAGPLDDSATDSEVDAGPPKDRLIFVTSAVFPANLKSQTGGDGGAPAGDAFCTDAARRAGRTGNYKVLLSDASLLAKNRVTEDASKPARPIIDSTGLKVATTIADLFQKGPAVAVNHTENGEEVAQDGTCGSVDAVGIVWTGANATGGRGDANPCGNWQSNAATQNAQLGTTTAGLKWLNAGCAQSCDKQAHLYCLQE